MARLIYWGLFLSDHIGHELPIGVKHQHVTCGYRTQPPAQVPFGMGETVRIIGYGNNGKNEGAAVERPRYYDGAEQPHITIGLMNKDCKAVNTGKLDFIECMPSVVNARWGWFGSDGKVHYTKPENF